MTIVLKTGQIGKDKIFSRLIWKNKWTEFTQPVFLFFYIFKIIIEFWNFPITVIDLVLGAPNSAL